MHCKDIPDLLVLTYARDWQYSVRERIFAVPGVLERLSQEYPVKMAWRKIERLVERGLLEYDMSPACAWPTVKGLALLEESE